MIFKNAHLFRLTEAFSVSTDKLEELLEERAFKPCSGIRPSSFGWVEPAQGLGLVHKVSGCYLLCARREDKVVPPSALNDILEEKIAKFEADEGRPIRSREKRRLKDDALCDLLPRALPKSRRIMGYISTGDDLLIIDTASAPEAEMFLGCLRDTLGSLKVTPPQVRAKPTDVFTHWLKTRKLPDNFSFGDQCDLMDPEDTSAISCRRQDLATSEIRGHLDAGKVCSRISVLWHGDLKVTIDKDLILRQLKIISSDDPEDEGEDPLAAMDAAFVNMAMELSRFLPELFSALGGETREQAI